MDSKIIEEFLNFYESMTRAQLNVIKQFRKSIGIATVEEPKEKRMSQMDMIYDILSIAGHPMHVNDIIATVGKHFNVQLDKESVVSALTKRVKRQDRFIKIGPNTFSLITMNQKGGGR